MKLMEFTYTKANGDISDRAVIITQEPNHLIGGIDISELSIDDSAEFIRDIASMKNRHSQEMTDLMVKHDLKHNYRQFSPEKMSNINSEWV